jgi:hypothetical protein
MQVAIYNASVTYHTFSFDDGWYIQIVFFQNMYGSRFVKSLGSGNYSLAFKRICSSRLVVAVKS